MGFKNTDLAVRGSDGRNWTLLEPLVYVTRSGDTITARAGSTSDGASTPRAVWSAIPPFGKYWLAAVLHDYLYRETSFDKDYCDSILYEAMLILGVEELEAKAIYDAVAVAGGPAFDADRKAQNKT